MGKQEIVRCAAAFGMVFMMAGCAPGSTDIQPPDIMYGQDMCEGCGMLIDEPQFAAALILEDGTPLKFDDVGEMFQYGESHPDTMVSAWFVHDYNTEAWLNAEAAYFVSASGLASPMGLGIAAFETQASARAFADVHGATVLTFSEMRDAAVAEPGMDKRTTH